MLKTCIRAVLLNLSLSALIAHASIVIPMYSTDPDSLGWYMGTVTADDTVYGLLLTPKLKDISPGLHTFRVYENPSCRNQGKAAGSTLDPEHMQQHKGPYSGNSDLGDLPVLFVDANHRATLPMLAPRLTLQDIQGHSLMILSGDDDYLDNPRAPMDLERVACGVIGDAH